MTERIDHAIVAHHILDVGESAVRKLRAAHADQDHAAADDYGKQAMGCWAQAQVHATLALVEQQRIANIVAFTTAGEFDMSADVAEQVAKDLGIWGGEN